jgi:hypothetical protein
MRALSLAATLSLLGAAPGQVTHLVGPGGHAQISHAIAAASPGDFVIVLPGSYQNFTLSFSLTVVAMLPGTVNVVGTPFTHTNVSLPVGQAHFVGLALQQVQVQGRATFDTCTIDGSTSIFTAPFYLIGAEVHLQSCIVRSIAASAGNLGTMWVTNSEVTAIDCTFEGPPATPTISGGTAVTLHTSRLRASRSTFTAGTGAGTGSAPALSTWQGGSIAYLADSTLVGNATCPIVGGSGRHARCTLMPNCSAWPAGSVLGISRQQPLQNGTPFVLELRTAPGMPIGIFAALDLANTPVPGLEQSALLPLAGAWIAGAVVADATGFATASWPIPAGSQFVHRSLWFQAVDPSSLLLQASAVTGGVIR